MPIDDRIDKPFEKLMLALHYSGIGAIIGFIYNWILKYLFGKEEKNDLTLGFGRQPVSVRWPALIFSLVIFIFLSFLLFAFIFKIIPGYNSWIKNWLNAWGIEKVVEKVL